MAWKKKSKKPDMDRAMETMDMMKRGKFGKKNAKNKKG